MVLLVLSILHKGVIGLLGRCTSHQQIEEQVNDRLILRVWIIDGPMDHSEGPFLEPQKMEYDRTMTTLLDVGDLGMDTWSGM